MGQPAQSIALLLMEHLRAPFAGPVLSYGKQAMNIGYDGTLKMLASLGIAPHADGMRNPPPPDEYIDFARLFSLLGLGELQTLDVSAYEGAEIIADLNLPVPPELIGRFGLIVDGGTMEHVFDIRQGMKNTADMLRPGGRAVHISPMNNYVNHGFVQLSPALYHDYYAANGFDDLRGIVIAQPRAEILSTDWNFVEYDHAAMRGDDSIFCSEETQMAIYFSAQKNPASTSDRVPARSSRGVAGYQFVISHGAGKPNIRQISEHDPGATMPAHEIVHVGFGSGRELDRL
jgi:SAM-dependent methyltransferase